MAAERSDPGRVFHRQSGGEHYLPKFVRVRVSEVGRAEFFYEDVGVFMPEPPMRMKCMELLSVASCS